MAVTGNLDAIKKMMTVVSSKLPNNTNNPTNNSNGLAKASNLSNSNIATNNQNFTSSEAGHAIWENWHAISKEERDLASQIAANKWGIEPNSWFVYKKSFSEVHGFFLKSALTYDIAPEILHAIAMGEGLASFIRDQRKYISNVKINSYEYLGLDNIADPNHFNELVQIGLNTNIKSKIKALPVTKNELNQNVYPATIEGYETAIELIAAEIKFREKKALEIAIQKNISIDGQGDYDNIDVLTFLTYAGFNNLEVLKDDILESDNLFKKYLKKYIGHKKEPNETSNVRYNTLLRLSVIEYYYILGIY